MPAERLWPTSTREVADIVGRAYDSGQRVKVVGAGHSFTSAALTDGVLLSLDKMDRVEMVDVENQRVLVQAGIRLFDLNDRLAEVGLAMSNLGDIAYQSIAGAIATATHGTGLKLGNLATTIVGMEIVTGTGETIWCDERANQELLRVARVGVGALGAVTKVMVQCVPAFNLHVAETIEPLDDLLDGYTENIEGNDHFEFFWMPGAKRAHVKRNNRTLRAEDPPNRVTHFTNKIIGENIAFDALNRVNRRRPGAVRKVAKYLPGGVEADYVGRSDKVFASPRHVRFYEMEYGMPVEAFPEAMRRVREFVSTLGMQILFPIEARVSAADDIPLSTANGRTSSWIAAHVYKNTSYDTYFNGIEKILDDYDGRPHWGKLHFQDHRTLESRYPEWDAFAETRAKLDPAGTFNNAYLDRVLGPLD